MSQVFIRLSRYVPEPEDRWDDHDDDDDVEEEVEISITLYKEQYVSTGDGWEVAGIDINDITRYFICSGYGIKRTSNSRSIWKKL